MLISLLYTLFSPLDGQADELAMEKLRSAQRGMHVELLGNGRPESGPHAGVSRLLGRRVALFVSSGIVAFWPTCGFLWVLLSFGGGWICNDWLEVVRWEQFMKRARKWCLSYAC